MASSQLDNTQKLQNQTLQECEIMLKYALENGKNVNPEILKKVKQLQNQQLNNANSRSTESSIDDIGSVHNLLAQAIAPATPSTVILMEKTKGHFFSFLGPVPMVRKMMILTLICLGAFLGLFIAPEVDSSTINGDILSYEPKKFLLNELFIVSAAALGAAFYALFEAYKYVSAASYDSKYDSIYWIRFVLGVVSGVILAQFLFVGDTGIAENTSGNMAIMTYKPLLAFLGGFSSRVVHKILESLVDSIETFISGSARDAVAAREAVAKSATENKIKALQEENARQEAANRLASVVQLMQLQEKLKGGANASMIEAALKELINQTIQPVNNTTLYTNEDIYNPQNVYNPQTNFTPDSYYTDNPSNPTYPTNPNSTNNYTPNTTTQSDNYNDIVIPDPSEFNIPDYFTGDLNINPNDNNNNNNTYK